MDPEDITPARAYREGFRWAPVVAVLGSLAVAVTAVVLLVGWLVAGWFQTHGIQRQYSNTVNSQSYQAALLAEMEQHVANITGPGGLAATRDSVPASSPEQAVIRSQELNEIASLCSESATFEPGVAPGSQQMQSVVAANCLAGAPVSAPPLAGPAPSGS